MCPFPFPVRVQLDYALPCTVDCCVLPTFYVVWLGPAHDVTTTCPRCGDVTHTVVPVTLLRLWLSGCSRICPFYIYVYFPTIHLTFTVCSFWRFTTITPTFVPHVTPQPTHDATHYLPTFTPLIHSPRPTLLTRVTPRLLPDFPVTFVALIDSHPFYHDLRFAFLYITGLVLAGLYTRVWLVTLILHAF